MKRAAVRDVTDQHRAKHELARLAAIVQSSDDAIISPIRSRVSPGIAVAGIVLSVDGLHNASNFSFSPFTFFFR